MNKKGKKCIECGCETHAIQLIDRGYENIQYEVVYAIGDSEHKVFKGHGNEGRVNAEMCDNCGRITLRAAPKD